MGIIKHNQALTSAQVGLKLTINCALLLGFNGVFIDSAYAAQTTYAALPNTPADNLQNAPSPEQNIVPVAYFDPIVISATRTQKNQSDAPVSIQVLDAKTLQNNHAQTLKQALDLLPNVNLVPLHGKTGYGVRMQGFTGDQVLILIDGLPISASTGSTVNLNQYLNTNVEQIEVIQGAASAQYGSAAMGGVINVITKPINASTAWITAQVGSNGSQNPSGDTFDNNHSYVEAGLEGSVSADQRLKARLTASYLEDEGLSVDTDAWPLLKDPSKQQQISAKVTYTPDLNAVNASAPPSQYWLQASVYSEEDISRFNYYVPPRYLAQQRDEDITRQRFSIGAHTTLPNNVFNTAFATTDNDKEVGKYSDTFVGDYKVAGSVLYEAYNSKSKTTSGTITTTARDTDITTMLAQAQLDLPFIHISDSNSHAIQLGMQWQQDTLEQSKNNLSELSGDDVDRDVIEAYIQDDWMLGLDTEVVIGARYQDDSDFGSHFAPKLAIKQDFYDDARRHTLRASIGTGYRVPNLKERYYVFDHSNFGYKVMGNPNLAPETSTSYQMGYQTQINDKVAISVNGFYNDVEDLIQTDNNNPAYDNQIAIYNYDNIDNAKTYGADAMIDWQINAKTALNLAYAYLQTENKNTGSDLTYSPEHKVTANLDYQFNDKLQLIGRVRYESEQLVNTATQSYSPSWWGLDSRANYSATPNLDVYLAINNLLDEQRQAGDPNDQRPVDNRQWIVGASYQW